MVETMGVRTHEPLLAEHSGVLLANRAARRPGIGLGAKCWDSVPALVSHHGESNAGSNRPTTAPAALCSSGSVSAAS